MYTTITSDLYARMIRVGASSLNADRKVINDLNVFPIPDGDTGDNMFMTIRAGADAISGSTLSETAASVSGGMLMGARGNSGVILSRIFAGISSGFANLESASLDEFTKALESGVRESYKAVLAPVEGTMLTVFREAVEKASGDSIESYLKSLLSEMEISLDNTPQLLPVLKEAGVVDSGGAGLICIFKGILSAVQGNDAESDVTQERMKKTSLNLDAFGPDTPLKFGYCTEFLLRLQTSKVGDPEKFDESVIKDYLQSAGDSVVCFRDGSIVKVHVHTRTPGEILNRVQSWGEFLTVKIENMTLQHSEVSIRNNYSKPGRKYACVAVVSGKGLADAFRDAGVSLVIEGGQTMNPSAADFIRAFDEVNAKTVFVLPNNSNIILTAQQAAGLYTKSRIIVLPSRDLGAGYVAAASLDFSSDNADDIGRAATESMQGVNTLCISRAIRNASQDGLEIREGEYVAIRHKGMVASCATPEQAVLEGCEKEEMAAHEVALVFYGGGVDGQNAMKLKSELERKYPRTEIMMTDGGQNIYEYIIVLC